jgi:hypothetical protein
MPGDIRQASLRAFEPTTLEPRLVRRAAAAEAASRAPGISGRSVWTALQSLLLVVGLALAGLLLFKPAVGIAIMWNILIPAAPALVVLAPGLWRNICPMSTVSLLPKKLGLSLRMKMPTALAAWLGLISIIALYVIVPLRHILLNTDGPATFVMLGTAAALAVLLGMLFEGRSGWCTSLCPIHPVEKLYGGAPAITFKNARCDLCELCTVPCPDTTPSISPAVTANYWLNEIVATLFIGSFWGFVFGWYQVPDYPAPVGAAEIFNTYAWPLGGAFVSFAVYNAIETWYAQTKPTLKILQAVFAAGAVSTYYWFRIPMLVGLGEFPGTGLLYDLSDMLPVWFPMASHAVTTSFFFWFLVIRGSTRTGWVKRTPFARTRGAAAAVAA